MFQINEMEEIKKRKINKGFTLIELMVATSLFVVIMLSAMGALFVLLDESRDSRSLRVAMDNVNFAMESMTRSIRMGTSYYCGISDTPGDTKGCISGADISFSPPPNSGEESNVKYRFIEGAISDGKWTNGTIKRYDSNSTEEGVSIVSPDVNIDLLSFSVKVPDDDNPQIQPSVYIIVKGTVSVNGVPTSFALQTMASQRNYFK